MKEPYSFVMTAEGRLPDAIRSTLARELPKHAGRRIRLTFEICNDDGTPLEGEDKIEVTDNR